MKNYLFTKDSFQPTLCVKHPKLPLIIIKDFMMEIMSQDFYYFLSDCLIAEPVISNGWLNLKLLVVSIQ